MQKTLLFILIFTVYFGYSQSEKDSYDIYSSNINIVIEDWFDKPLKSILIVKKFKNKYEEDFSLINVLAQDSIPIYALDWLVRDSILRKRFIKDNTLKKSITELTKNFKNHPTINKELLKLNNVEIKVIKSSKYYSFHKRHKNGWSRIEDIYETNLVFQLSKIKYTGKYATFYYSYHCGGLCASANFVIMEKIGSEWKLLKNFQLWVS